MKNNIHYLIIDYTDPETVSENDHNVSHIKFWDTFSNRANQILADCDVLEAPQFDSIGFHFRVVLNEEKAIKKAKQISKLLYNMGVTEGDVSVAPRVVSAVVTITPKANKREDFFQQAKKIAQENNGFCEIKNQGSGHDQTFLNIPLLSGNPWEAQRKAESILDQFDINHLRRSVLIAENENWGQAAWKRNMYEEKELHLNSLAMQDKNEVLVNRIKPRI